MLLPRVIVAVCEFFFWLAPPFTIYAEGYGHAASNNPFANTRCTPYTINMIGKQKTIQSIYYILLVCRHSAWNMIERAKKRVFRRTGSHHDHWM